MLDPVRRRIARQVSGLFNDRSKGEAPVQRRPAESWFGPASPVWRVHGDVTSMMVGGIASLLLQMLHPRVLAGVWDHSNFRADMHGRLKRTARFIAVTTYASEADARAAIARVRAIHHHVRGTLPDGTPYAADDPRLLAWVHVTETWSFLEAWMRYAEPRMSRTDQDRYFADVSRVGEALGADPVPRSRAEAEALMAAMRSELKSDARTREVARLVLRHRTANPVTATGQRLLNGAAIDLLPPWARRMHGFGQAPMAAPFARAGTLGVARTLRWAFG